MSNLFLYGVTVLVWGSTWMAIEYQLGVVAPEVSVFYRYALASGLLFAWSVWRGRRLRFPAAAHGRFLLLGMALFSLNYALTYHAQAFITSALTAIVFSTMLWMNILNARIWFGTRSAGGVLLGSLLGVAGIAVLFFPEVNALSLGDATLIGTLLALSGAFVASLGNMVSQAAQRAGLPIVQSNAWGMFYGAFLTGVYSVTRGLPFNFDTSPGYVLSLGYLAVFGSIVAFGTYLTLLGRIGAQRAGYAMVMFPVVAIVISLLVGEIVATWNVLVGAALAIAGNVLVLAPERERRSARPVVIPGRPRHATK